jgi:hypothetical protein
MKAGPGPRLGSLRVNPRCSRTVHVGAGAVLAVLAVAEFPLAEVALAELGLAGAGAVAGAGVVGWAGGA